MRSDVKVLLKVFGWSCGVAAVAVGIGLAVALGASSKEAGAAGALAAVVGGGVPVGTRSAAGLAARPDADDRPAAG
jgi:hypothetical protein